MNIPNTLTLLRIIFIPVYLIVFLLPIEHAYTIACTIFVIASITDLLDGYLARKLDQTSNLGAFLDPVADKLMVAVVLILLVQRDPSLYLVIPSIIIISREISVSALREWMAEVGERSAVAVSSMGKIKTICQMVSLGFLTYQNDLWGLPIYGIGLACLYIAAILTFVSMIQYLRAAWPNLNS